MEEDAEAPLNLDDEVGGGESEAKRIKTGLFAAPSEADAAAAAVEALLGTDPNLWSINKVQFYSANREKYPSQRFVAENSDVGKELRLVDATTVECSGGYRTARAAFGLCEGASYFEVVVPAEGNVRVGWGSERGDPGAGVGYDGWQYGMRIDGTVFHESRGRRFGESFVPGDVLGTYIYLPPKPTDGSEERPRPVDPKRPLTDILMEQANCWIVRVLPGQPYTLPTSDVMQGAPFYYGGSLANVPVPVPRPGSAIFFFKNGVCLGGGRPAFSNLTGATYYPSVSPYRTRVKACFGPVFAFPPNVPAPFAAPKPASEL